MKNQRSFLDEKRNVFKKKSQRVQVGQTSVTVIQGQQAILPVWYTSTSFSVPFVTWHRERPGERFQVLPRFAKTGEKNPMLHLTERDISVVVCDWFGPVQPNRGERREKSRIDPMTQPYAFLFFILSADWHCRPQLVCGKLRMHIRCTRVRWTCVRCAHMHHHRTGNGTGRVPFRDGIRPGNLRPAELLGQLSSAAC
ncbi:hypothetical protein L345_07459, partial [Ophiophagus hannah]